MDNHFAKAMERMSSGIFESTKDVVKSSRENRNSLGDSIKRLQALTNKTGGAKEKDAILLAIKAAIQVMSEATIADGYEDLIVMLMETQSHIAELVKRLEEGMK